MQPMGSRHIKLNSTGYSIVYLNAYPRSQQRSIESTTLLTRGSRNPVITAEEVILKLRNDVGTNTPSPPPPPPPPPPKKKKSQQTAYYPKRLDHQHA